MIYLVTTNTQLFESDLYKVISVEESIKLLETLEEPGLDTETEGIDEHTKKLLLVQIGCKEFQVVIDCRTIDIRLYKKYLESDRIFLGWNLKFDLKFFLKQGIVIKKIYDGFLAEKLLWLGYPAGMHGMSLKAAGQKYCGIELDKTVRGKIIWSKTLTDDIILYGADDVKYLPDIKEAQMAELRKKDLVTALAYENNFCPVLAYTEFCGTKLDESKWRKIMEKNKKELDSVILDLNSWIVNLQNREKYKYINSLIYVDLQGDLWSGFDTSPHCSLNWSSPKQLIPFFEELGFNLETFDKKTKEKKKSVGAEIIEKQRDLQPELVDLYSKYKALEKLVSTYGENVLKQINSVTGRIHTNFNQIGTDTARLSSGGKDKENNVEYLNFQNFPRDTEIRACFISEPGYKWISCDYSAQESRVIADLSQDPSVLELFRTGCGDMHSLVAKMAFSDIIGNCPVENIKSEFKSYRQQAKSIEFAINYGGNAQTIKSNNHIPLEEAEKIYNNYMEGFPGIKAYQDKQRWFVMKYGYILLNEKTRHKAFIYDFDELSEIRNKFNAEYWQTYKAFKQANKDSEIVEEVKHYFRRKSDSEKQAIDYKCQGTGAVQFKLASIWLYKYLIEHDLLFKVKLCIPAHDEWNIEVPEDISEEMSNVLIDCMKRAGEYFCPSLEFPAESEVSDHWIH